LRVEEGAWTTEVLQATLEDGRLDARGRALATALTSGTIRRRLQLDHVISQFSKTPIEKMDREVRNVLRLGVYQIMHTRIPGYAACNSAVELIRRTPKAHASGFINGILRSVLRGLDSVEYPDPDEDPVGWISVTESHPRWMVRWWMEQRGFADTLAWCRANNRSPDAVIRINRLAADPAVFEDNTFVPCRYAPDGRIYRGEGNPARTTAYAEGMCSVQSEAAQLLTRAVIPAPGWDILDGCAGRGGKTTYLAELSGDEANIVAVDTHEEKLSMLMRHCERLGLQSIRTRSGDLRALPAPQAAMDLVLLDVPCSGMGIIGREPEARWHKTPGMLRTLPKLQRQLLWAGARWVRPGGFLVYATCSIAPEENGAVVEAFLRAHANFRPGHLDEELPGRYRNTMQLLPHVHGMDGSYAAVLRREHL